MNAWDKFNHSLKTDLTSKFVAFDPFPTITVHFIKTFSGWWIEAPHDGQTDLLRQLECSQLHFLRANWELMALTSIWKQMVAHQWRTSRTSCRQVSHYMSTNCPLSFEKCLACLQERLGKGNDCYIAGEWWEMGTAGPFCFLSHWAFSSLSPCYFTLLFPPLSLHGSGKAVERWRVSQNKFGNEVQRQKWSLTDNTACQAEHKEDGSNRKADPCVSRRTSKRNEMKEVG